MSKNKKKITEYFFTVPILNQNFKIFIGYNRDLQSFFDKKDIVFDKIDDADAAFFSLDQYMCLWFEPNPKIDIIAHECCHATFALMKSRGLNLEDEEMFCYLQEFIVNNVLKCLKITSRIVTDHTNRK